MKHKIKYTLYLLAKPGDERFFVFTRLPNAAWLKTQRENGFEFLETEVYMPERYDIDVDGTANTSVDSDPTHAQVGGDHYAKMAIQPEEYIAENDIGYHEGCVIKYVSRWKDKGGLEDLRKARHFLDLKIVREEKKRLRK